MKALLCYSKDDFHIEEIKKPSISDDQMLIELIYCGLCGSDIVKIFNTSPDSPAIYGHEVVGKVVEVGDKIKKFKIGDTVVAAHHIPCGKCHYCMHGNHTMCTMFKETNIYPGGFCQYILLSQDHIKNTTFLLPEGTDLLEALFIEPLACCIRAMDRMSFLRGDIISIVGAGAIGILFVKLARLAGLDSVVIDLDIKRLKLAKQFGAHHIINPADEDLRAELEKIAPLGIDSAILTVTNKYTVADALAYIRAGGEINIFGMGLDQKPIPVDFNRIYKSELTLRSSYSATPETLSRAFDLIIKEEKIDVSGLVSDVLPLSDFKKGLDLMLDRKVYKAFYRL
jgi:L-iditol 2-dehydrogenase